VVIRHLRHARGDADAQGGKAAKHEVRHIAVVALDFPLLRSQYA
jgi:hypothetical protein